MAIHVRCWLSVLGSFMVGGAAAAAQVGPVAYVLEHEDQWTKSAHGSRLLAGAGFRVEVLPLDRSPAGLEGELIFIGSFASDEERYRAYMAEYGGALAEFVQGGGVLVQMTQTDQAEVSPPFLPSSIGAGRDDDDFGAVAVVKAGHPLVRGVGAEVLSFHTMRTVWETFFEQGGFEVIMCAIGAEGALVSRPALMESAHGEGRIVLSAMALDKEIAPASGRTAEGDAALGAFRGVFFSNLREHVERVAAGEARAVEATPGNWVPPFTQGAWTLAVLPDTQIYSLKYPGMFIAQTGWIAANRERWNIRQVVHLGDIVHNNTAREWRNARDALGLLDGVVPWAMAPGNHDYGPGGSASTRETLLNEYFEFGVHAAQATFGGAMEEGKLDNTYHLFEAGGREWIVVCLEWGPRDETVLWANSVMEAHAGRTGILVTHAYMFNNDLRYDHTDTVNPQTWNPHNYKTPGAMNDGEQLWQKLVRKHNFAFTLNGHVLGDGTGYLASVNDLGFTVHQMLANYQMRELGGEGYLRLLEFQPDGRTVRVKSYSPVMDRYLTEPDQWFEIVLDQPMVAGARP